MQFAEPPDCAAVPPQLRASRRMLPRLRRRSPAHAGPGARHSAARFSSSSPRRLFEKIAAIRCGVRPACRPRLVDLMPDFEQPELIEMFRVLDDVAMDARQQRRAQQLLPGRDRIQHANVIFEREAEPPRFFFADERIVRNFGVALRGHHALDAAQEFALRRIERRRAGNQRRLSARWNRSRSCGPLLRPDPPAWRCLSWRATKAR